MHRNHLGFSYREDPDAFDLKWDQGVGISNKLPRVASVQLPHFEEAEELLRKGPYIPRPHSSYIFSDDVVSVIRSNIQAALVETDKKLQSGGKWDLFCLFNLQYFTEFLLWVIVNLHKLGSSNSKIAFTLTVNRKVTSHSI